MGSVTAAGLAGLPGATPTCHLSAGRLIRWARTLVARSARGTPARAAIRLLESLAGSRPGCFAALTYHRVDERHARPWLHPSLLSATPADFANQMEMLLRQYQPVGLPDVLAASRDETVLPPRSVLVTFDDAYQDFRENAWPVLRRLGIPVTLFVPTAFPDRPERSFWWDRLWQAVVDARGRAALETPLGPLRVTRERQRYRAASSLVEFHKTLPHDEAMHSVDALCERLSAQPARSEVLGWDDLRALAAEGVFVAPHSRNHPLLTRVSAAVLRAEMEGSLIDIETHVPQRVKGAAFAYPGGRFDQQTTEMLRELRFDLAFTTERGTNRLGHTDPLCLRRINVGRRAHSDLIRGQLAVGTLRHRTIGR